MFSRALNIFRFTTVTTLRGKPQRVGTNDVKLRGLCIQSTRPDAPNLIFIPEIFDQAESWVNFFMSPTNKLIQDRNVYILYPRNFGTSDHNDNYDWEEQANDVHRFMYEHKIGTATLAGHGIGAKIALATACYHSSYVTGYVAIDSCPTDQYYHLGFIELRKYLDALNQLNLNRGYGHITADLKKIVLCPKWRSIFESNLIKKDQESFAWRCNWPAIYNNIHKHSVGNMLNWSTYIGLWAGRAIFMTPEYSRFVFLNTNTIPMEKVCIKLIGYNRDIFFIQGDENPQNHWVYELPEESSSYIKKTSEFIRNYDGVDVLLQCRDEIGKVYLPNQRNHNELVAQKKVDAIAPGHYYHNWRFKNVYETK